MFVVVTSNGFLLIKFEVQRQENESYLTEHFIKKNINESYFFLNLNGPTAMA